MVKAVKRAKKAATPKRATHHLLAIEGSQEPVQEIPLDTVARQLRFVAPQLRDRLKIADWRVD